jgi:hypothetical protein
VPCRAVLSISRDQTSNNSTPDSVKWVSATTGWAGGMLRTTDGGAHWSKAGPALPKDASSGYAEFFLDGSHAWVARAAGSPESCADHAYSSYDAIVSSASPDASQSLPAKLSTKRSKPSSCF